MRIIVMAAAAAVLLASPAFAAAKSYQVTGAVTEVSADTVTVQKGKEKWQLNTAGTAPKDLKVGDKVMVEYSMTATKVTVKDDKAKK